MDHADFALWQRDVVAAVEKDDAAYWRSRLAGAPEQLQLPWARPRPERTGGPARTHDFTIGAELHARVRALGRSTRTTSFMVLHAAFAATLAQLGCGDDLVIGTPVAGRDDEALRDSVGFFINTLPLRVDLGGTPSFLELLERTRHGDLAALTHQRLPLDRIVAEVNPPRLPGVSPLFQVLFAVREEFPDRVTLPGQHGRPRLVPTGAAKFDLQCTISEDPVTGTATGQLEYRTDLWDARAADRFGRALLRVLEQVTADPARPVATLTAAPGPENAAPAPRSVPPTGLAELCAAQAARTPDRTALVSGDEQLTYSQLDGRAARLAGILAERGAGPGTLVAIALPGAPISSSPCSPPSGPGPPTCRSTPASRPSGSGCCSPTPRPPGWSPTGRPPAPSAPSRVPPSSSTTRRPPVPSVRPRRWRPGRSTPSHPPTPSTPPVPPAAPRGSSSPPGPSPTSCSVWPTP